MIKSIRTQADGSISGNDFSSLQVVGFHGQLGTDQTPAQRSPVYANSKGHQVTILDSSPYGTTGRHTLKIKVAAKPISDDTWSMNGTGTRLDQAWPAKLSYNVIIVGDREISISRELLKCAGATLPGRVTAFLRWLTIGSAHHEGLLCSRVDSLVAWYANSEEITALCSLIAAWVRERVLDCAQQPDMLKRMSFWLSRSAVDDSDMFLAVAGLRESSFTKWETVLHAGVITGSKKTRINAVDDAMLRLSSHRWVAGKI